MRAERGRDGVRSMRARGVVHAGVCVDPREGVECPDNASCVGGACACDAGYKPILDMGDDPFEPEPELVCVDACAGVLCTGDNAHCSNGACKCDEGHHDPDGDGNCTKVCGPDEVDDVAKASLKAIPKEPWERSESYSCENNTVVVVEGNSSSSLYSHHDYPENSQPNPNRGSVCEVALAFRLAVATPIRTSSIQGTAWRCVGRK